MVGFILLSAIAVVPLVAQEISQSVAVPVHSLITQPLDEARLTVLKGNTHPFARPEFDLGMAPASLPMERMLLVLKRSDEQETALRKLLDDQQDKSSPDYHKWLTPEQFGTRFGPSDADMLTITSWLQLHGFEVKWTKGRTVLEFSGSASQVQEAFHTSIHKYIVKGVQHWANAKDPSIPAALAPVLEGVMSLHNFVSKPLSHVVTKPTLAQVVEKDGKRYVTFPGSPPIHALAPQDFAVIYNVNPSYNTWSGAGITIGVVARNDLFNNGQDIQDFRNTIGSGNNTFGSANLNVIVNGPDPGNAGRGEEGEATLDATWSGAIAPGATVDFVVSGGTNTTDGIDLSELYIIENNLADIMTESFGSCEYFQTDARIQGVTALAEQAAAQGITYFVSTGDNGSEGCDDPGSPPATNPISVNVLASTAFNVAVGGTMFNDTANPTQYWSSNSPISETALSYIPENVWNESSPTNGLWSGSGGASAGNPGGGTRPGIPKPSWQSGANLNIPQDNVRDLPDVSLTSAIHDPYLLCFEASCVPDSQGFISVYFIGGTSAAAPSFAGIMALIDQSAGGRQGQVNYTFYSLAQTQAAAGTYPGSCNGSSTTTPPAGTCIFNDITVGNNVVPGEVGSQYQAQAGYDLTTGLGSVNVANLIQNWTSTAGFSPTTTALKLNSDTVAFSIAHGQQVRVDATVTPSSGTTMPTGDVILYTSLGNSSNPTLDLYALNSIGQASGLTTALPGNGGNTYNVWAHYSGDGKFAPSDSNQITVTVTPEASKTALSLQVSSVTGVPVSSPYPFGSLVFVRVDVASATGSSCQAPKFIGCPTGPVRFTDTFGAIPTINPQVNPPVAVVNNPTLNSQGNTSIGDGIISFDAGTHTISATYAGDGSFSTSSSTAPVTFTIQPGFIAVAGPTDVSITSPGLSGTTTIGIVASSNFTTPIAFTCSGLPSEATCGPASATGQGPNNVISTNITVGTTAAHTTMLHSRESRYYYATLLGTGLPFAIFFVAGPRRKRWSGVAVLMMLIGLVMVPACGGGGGSSSHHQDPGTPAGSYTIVVTATAGGITQQGSFTLVVK